MSIRAKAYAVVVAVTLAALGQSRGEFFFEQPNATGHDLADAELPVEIVLSEATASMPLPPLDESGHNIFMPQRMSSPGGRVNTEGIYTSEISLKTGDAERSSEGVSGRQLASSQIHLYVPDVPATGFFQDDDWSCGVQSTTRVLRAYGFGVSYQSQKIRVGYFPFNLEFNFCTGIDLCRFSFRIENSWIGMGRPPSNLAARLRELGYPHWRHETGSNMERLKQLLLQKKPIVALIRNFSVVRTDLCHNFGGFIGRRCLFSVTIPGLHYITLIGYNNAGFLYVDTYDNSIQTYAYGDFDYDWNFKGWKTGLVYDLFWSTGARPRSFLFYDQALVSPPAGCSCDCCPSGSVGCLVPCGCNCKVPSSHFIRLKIQNKCHKEVWFDAYHRSISPSLYSASFTDSPWSREGVWRWSGNEALWWTVDPGQNIYYADTNTLYYYYYAKEETTGAVWGGNDLYRTKNGQRLGLKKRTEPSLGVTSQINLVCDSLGAERYRVNFRNSCEWYGDLMVILYYYDLDSLTWKTGRWIIRDDGSELYIANSKSRNIYYYATDVATESVEWSGTDSYTTWGGKRYGLRHIDMGSTYNKYTTSITCTCTPVSCIWNDWGSWSVCFYDSRVEGYVRYRMRSHQRESNACGEDCSGPSIEWLACDPPTLRPTTMPTPQPTRRPSSGLPEATSPGLPKALLFQDQIKTIEHVAANLHRIADRIAESGSKKKASRLINKGANKLRTGVAKQLKQGNVGNALDIAKLAINFVYRADRLLQKNLKQQQGAIVTACRNSVVRHRASLQTEPEQHKLKMYSKSMNEGRRLQKQGKLSKAMTKYRHALTFL